MKYYNDRDRFVITHEQYSHLPSALHKLTVDILVGRSEWTLKGDRIANLKKTGLPRKLP